MLGSKDFWNYVRNHQLHLRVGFLFALLLLVFTLMSLALGTPGSAAYLIALVDLVLVVALLVGVSVLLWGLAKRDDV